MSLPLPLSLMMMMMMIAMDGHNYRRQDCRIRLAESNAVQLEVADLLLLLLSSSFDGTRRPDPTRHRRLALVCGLVNGRLSG